MNRPLEQVVVDIREVCDAIARTKGDAGISAALARQALARIDRLERLHDALVTEMFHAVYRGQRT